MNTKPLILFFSFNLLSHYLRCLQLADELRDSFKILFPYSETYKNWLEKYATFQCEAFDVNEVMKCVKKFDFSWLSPENIERVFLSQVEAIEKYRPVIVIGDAAFTLNMAAEKCNVPYISVINGYMSKYYSLTRTLSRTHKAHKFIKKLPVRTADTITQVAERLAFRRVHLPFKDLRKKYMLKRLKSYSNELEGDHTLICDVPELFPQKTLPPSYHFIGPLFFSSCKKERDIIEKLDCDKPTILVSLGSTGDWKKLHLLNNPIFHEFTIITTGDKELIIHGNHVISTPFLNNISVLPLIDVMICHGGNGTIYQALSCNVPILGLTSHFEQEWNMNRIEQLGLGASMDHVTSASELKSMVLKMIEKKSAMDFKKFMIQYNSGFRKEVLYRVLS